MIPVKLTVCNFMPYRDNVPPLNFTGIHTATIAGDNGVGKSALIDAMTWALWGKARAKSVDDLIHLGQTEMAVEFDFAIGQQVYRVIRKRSKPKKLGAAGRSSVDLLISNGDGFKVISGNTIDETEQKIILDILHMDYETFINSAYLRQGHADEFTEQPPAKRKEVLASILELARYDELEERAKALAKQRETEKVLAENTISGYLEELAQKPVYEAELAQAQTELSRMDDSIKEQESRLNELRQQTMLLKNKKVQLDQLEEHERKTEADLKRWNEHIEQRRQRIKEYEDLIAQRANIEEGYAQFVKAKALCEELEHKFRHSVRLESQKQQLDSKIRETGQSLVTEHAVLQSKIGELEASYRKLPQLKENLREAQAELSKLVEPEAVANQKRQASQELRSQIHELESGNLRLQQEIEEIGEKLNLLSEQTEAKCPLCGKDLESGGLEHIEAEYKTQLEKKSGSVKSNQAEVARKKKELASLETETSRLEAKLGQDKALIQNKIGFLSQQIVEVEGNQNQMNESREKLVSIEERLARKDFAAREQEALREIETEISKLGYDSTQHEEVRQRLTNLEQYENPKRKLEDADRLFKQEKEEAVKAEQAIQEISQSLEADKQRRQELLAELSSLPQLVVELENSETEHQKLVIKQKQAQEIVGSVKGKLQRCAELEIKKQEKSELLRQVVKEESIYQELAKDFGKEGIQAWLIEMAFPEIEAEANRLLSRMTDNRMTVKLESQRETKKGDVVETLDIKIADELGTRNYEMFSGGEAFRINFAIRIALSKLLARRAGAPLRTLIIDEGFGTQDATGLEKIKEAITSIQDDFDKVIIITHIEELRDAFPTRIDVIKTEEGSTIEVN